MAEDTEASTGYAGEVWLSTDATTTNLTELVEVVSFSLPSDTAERVETTHLEVAQPAPRIHFRHDRRRANSR